VSNTVAEEDPEARRAEEHREEEDAKLDAGEPEEDDGRPENGNGRTRSHLGGQPGTRFGAHGELSNAVGSNMLRTNDTYRDWTRWFDGKPDGRGGAAGIANR